MKINKRNILIFFAAGLVMFIIAGILLLSGPRMKTQPSLRTFEAEVPLPPEGTVAFHPENEDYQLINFNDLPLPSPENIQRGNTYYHYYCIFCHGENGKGNGPVGESYMPKPADLTSPEILSYNNDELYKASFTGTGHSPVLEKVVPAEHRKYLLVFLRNLNHDLLD